MLVMSVVVFLVVVLVMLLLPAPAKSQEIQAPPSQLVAGIRMHHDAHFYLVGGFSDAEYDLLAGLGMNNGTWVGAHFAISLGELSIGGEVQGYAGAEMAIRPGPEINEFSLSVPIGLRFTMQRLAGTLAAMIYPGIHDEPVRVGFAVAIMYGIRDL